MTNFNSDEAYKSERKSPSTMNKDTQSIVGKTIKSIDRQAINCWRFNFTDGTHKFMWAEPDGPLNLGQLWVSSEE